MAEHRIQETGREKGRKTREVLYTGKWVSAQASVHSFLSSLHPPSQWPLPPNPEQGDIPEETAAEKLPSLDLIPLSHKALKRPCWRDDSAAARTRTGGLTTAHINLPCLVGCWNLTRHQKTPAWEERCPVPLRVQVWSHLAGSDCD